MLRSPSFTIYNMNNVIIKNQRYGIENRNLSNLFIYRTDAYSLIRFHLTDLRWVTILSWVQYLTAFLMTVSSLNYSQDLLGITLKLRGNYSQT